MVPADQGLFRRCAGRRCGYVFGLWRGELSPPALMLSADPLPHHASAFDCAEKAARPEPELGLQIFTRTNSVRVMVWTTPARHLAQ